MKTSMRQSFLALGAQATAFSLLSGPFGFYYVNIFMNHYHIEQKWFQFSQVLYMIWNAVNDPLFAYFQDKSNTWFTRTRRESVLYCAPFFALSFLVPWFPWGSSPVVVGLHLIFSLLFWDSMFTFVGLAYCALFTEICDDQVNRLKLTRICSIGSLIGTCSILLLEFSSDSLKNYRYFQVSSVFVALLSWWLFRYAGLNAHTKYDLEHMADEKKQSSEIAHDKNVENSSYWRLTFQILSNTNFLSFVLMNFLQEYHRTYVGNFTSIFCEQLVPTETVPKWIRSFFYGSTRFLPTLFVLCTIPLVTRIGYFVSIQASFVWKIVSGIAMYMFGRTNPWMIMVFLLLDSIFSNGAFHYFNLPLADVCDSDMVKYKRSHPISSMVFGTNALIVKPAISVAPMIVAALLNMYGYADLNKNTLSTSELGSLRDVMFTLITIQPVIIGILQYCIWSVYTIRGTTSDLSKMAPPQDVIMS